MFSDFNDPLYIRQKGLQLPDNPRHGFRHGIQAQGVAVQQHVAQIFLTRGFDNCVLRLKGVGAKPVQKLSKHRKLVEACGPVHDNVYRCLQIRAITGGTRSHRDAAGRRPGKRTCAP